MSIAPCDKDVSPLLLNLDRWVPEVYRTVIITLQSTAWLLLVFGVALFACIVVRVSAKPVPNQLSA